MVAMNNACYPENSRRFRTGNDVVSVHLPSLYTLMLQSFVFLIVFLSADPKLQKGLDYQKDYLGNANYPRLSLHFPCDYAE